MIDSEWKKVHWREKKLPATIHRIGTWSSTLRPLQSLLYASLTDALGRFKTKWKLLRKAPEYPLEAQIMLIYAPTAVSNFLIDVSDGVEEDFEGSGDSESCDDEGTARERLYNWRNKVEMKRKRDRIAAVLWTDYIEELARRRRFGLISSYSLSNTSRNSSISCSSGSSSTLALLAASRSSLAYMSNSRSLLFPHQAHAGAGGPRGAQSDPQQ